MSFATPLEPGLGVLAHITSIPGGDFGAGARHFVDWLADAGARYWQILPLNPTDEFASPYAGISAFAGNTDLICVEEGEGGSAGAKAGDRVDARAHNGEGSRAGAKAENRVDARVHDSEGNRAEDSADTCAGGDESSRSATGTVTFGPRSTTPDAPWLDQYAAFMRERTGADPDHTRRAQHAFDRQWYDLRSYANSRGIQIIGDMPLYVGPASVDVQTRPELFQLDDQGRPTVVAGCPPDGFAPEGQIWNNPVYDWDAVAADGYAWWIARLRRAFELYDVVRLDHFIGFAHYYSIPAGHPAGEGYYRSGPGIQLFRAAYEELGPLPVIAEDLGYVTDEVRQLVADCGFPGMDVLQFADDPLGYYDPPANMVAYTGTHDNQTLVGYCRARYPHLDPHETARILMQRVRDCGAAIRIFPLQDLLGLDDEARMNTPGTQTGNWAWRAERLPAGML